MRDDTQFRAIQTNAATLFDCNYFLTFACFAVKPNR